MSGTAPTNLNPVSMSTEKPAEPEPIHGPMGESLAEPDLPPAYAGWGDPETGKPDNPIAQDIDAGAGLLQEVIDFLHRLFPGHGAPGTPSTPPEQPAP